MDFKVNNYLKTYGLDKPTNTTKTVNTGKTSSAQTSALAVSDSVLEYQSTLSKVRDTSDIREDQVTKFKKQIDDGSYTVSTSALADKLLGL